METWKEIKGFEGLYFISNLGNVKNKDGKFIAPHDNGYGKLVVDLYGGCLNGPHRTTKTGAKRLKVHRLAAEHFIPNTAGYRYVKHVDVNKLHVNSIDNLYWSKSSLGV